MLLAIERASPHGGPFSGLAAARYHTVATERRCASQQKLCADVADGSNSVIRPCRLDVRFAQKRTRLGDLRDSAAIALILLQRMLHAAGATYIQTYK